MQLVPAPVCFQPFTVPLPFHAGGAAVLLPPRVGESHVHETLITSVDRPDGGTDGSPAPTELGRAPYATMSISAREILERAATLKAVRLTWESIVPPADPILDEKRQPHVVGRRKRFTRMVKVGLGGCLAVCAAALGLCAFADESPAASSSASSSSSPTEATSSASSEALSKTVPAKAVIPVEALECLKHGKASRRSSPAVATAAIHAKRR